MMPAPVRAAALGLPWLVTLPLLAQAERPPETFQVALGLQQRGLHDEAARQFTAFLKDHRQHALAAEASYRLGSCHAELGAVAPAVAALQQALELAAKGKAFKLQAECRFRLGQLLQGQGEPAAAVAQFEALLQEVPGDHYLVVAARFGAGEGWRDRHDDERAATAFAAAATAAKGDAEHFRFPAYYQLGFARLRQADFDAAATAFAAAAAATSDPAGRGECHYLRGDALLRLGRADDAEQAFRTALAAPSDYADDAAYGLCFVVLGRGDHAATAAAFAKFLADHRSSPWQPAATLELGRALYRSGQPSQAAAVLGPLDGDQVEPAVRQGARELLGLCALAGGEGESAVKALQEALAGAAPAEQPRLQFALAEALAALERHAEAAAAYDAVAAAAGPELRGDALYGACYALHRHGQHRPAIERAEALLALQPRHRLAGAAAFAVAECRYALQEHAVAATAFAALADDPEFAAAAGWKLAYCHYLGGDKVAATAAFLAASQRDGSPFAEEALAMAAQCQLETGAAEAALASADRYQVRYPQGRCLERTERVAARVLRQRGDLAGAERRLAKAMAASGDAAAQGADRFEQAELAYHRGDFAAAAERFAALADRADELGARACLGQAWCAFELGDAAACAALLDRAEAHPRLGAELAAALELRSALQQKLADWPAAAATAARFLARFADHPKAAAMALARGVALSRAGEHAAAAKVLAELQQADRHPDPALVAYELGWARRHAGDEAGALQAFAAVVKHGDGELAGEARLHLGVAALDGKDLGKAGELLTAVTGSHRPRALYRLAFARFEAAGEDPQGLAAVRDLAAELAQTDDRTLAPEGQWLLAECRHRLGDHAGAAAVLGAMLQAAADHARADRARLLLGEVAAALGTADAAAAAIPALEALLAGAEVPAADQARARLWLGRARLARQQAAAAEADFAAAAALSDGPVGAEAQFRIGEARLQRGDVQGAADAFVKLPILYAHPTWVRQGLLQAGLAYQRLQQPQKAKRFFTELVQQHAGSAEATAAQQHLTAADGGQR